MLVCQIQDLTERPSDNSREGKDAGKERKESKRATDAKQAHRHGGDSVFMTPHSHLDNVYAHPACRKVHISPRTTHC